VLIQNAWFAFYFVLVTVSTFTFCLVGEMSKKQVSTTSHTGQDLNSVLAYEFVKNSFRVISTIFFREIRTSGVHQVPTDKPCIFIVAPHANQVIKQIMRACHGGPNF
jgi:hypothetical protein